MACRLQKVWPRVPCALPAQMALVIALTALAALGLSGAPFHQPFHAEAPMLGDPAAAETAAAPTQWYDEAYSREWSAKSYTRQVRCGRRLLRISNRWSQIFY
jgi:hypothetical protein